MLPPRLQTEMSMERQNLQAQNCHAPIRLKKRSFSPPLLSHLRRNLHPHKVRPPEFHPTRKRPRVRYQYTILGSPRLRGESIGS